MKKSFIDSGIDDEKIEIVGHPALEKTFSDKYSENQIKTLRSKFPDKKQIACLFLDPVGKRKETVGYNELDVIFYCVEGLRRATDDFTLIIKCHPRNEVGPIRDAIKGKENIFLIENNLDFSPLDLLNLSDKVLGMTSIMLIHSLVLKKPTRSIQINATPAGKLRSNPHLDKVLCKSIDDIEVFFNAKLDKISPISSCIFEGSCARIYKALRKNDFIYNQNKK
ncbi:MAG: hypothetical protein CMB80_17850 [Flammeovirgaceae bacterium]|nr:hypothetical protein [Flammeovirgaceae bacterium]